MHGEVQGGDVVPGPYHVAAATILSPFLDCVPHCCRQQVALVAQALHLLQGLQGADVGRAYLRDERVQVVGVADGQADLVAEFEGAFKVQALLTVV